LTCISILYIYRTYYLIAASFAPPRLKKANSDRETAIDPPIDVYYYLDQSLPLSHFSVLTTIPHMYILQVHYL
jgi:hypothetical protein